MPPSIEEVKHALDVLSSVDKDIFADDDLGRLQALVQTRDLSRRLEKPREALTREIWMQPAMSTAIKLGQDLELFNKLPQQGSGVSLDEIARTTKATPEFLQRILRLLVITQFVNYDEEHDTYRGTPLAKSFTGPGFIGGMTHLFCQVWPCFAGLPSFFAKAGYKSPEDPSRGPWQHGLRTNDAFFDWLAERPAQAEGFHHLMASSHAAPWTAEYPVSRLLDDGPGELSVTTTATTTTPPLIVDVGGGLGEYMRHLRKALSNWECRVQVQEMESVVRQGRDLHPGEEIEFVAHSFFDPQPITGVKAYFMHSILHDWPDPLAIKILGNLRAAMTMGYSKLLLCERVVPAKGFTSIAASMDWIMLGLLCAKERTEEDWTRLLQEAGFHVEKIWTPNDKTKASIIEAIPTTGYKIKPGSLRRPGSVSLNRFDGRHGFSVSQ